MEIPQCFQCALIPVTMIYFLEMFTCQFTSHQGKDMFTAILSLSVGTEINFWYKGEFWGGGWRDAFLWISYFYMQCSDTSSPSDKSYYAICICLSFTWCLNFSADVQKMQMCFLVDWRAIMQQLISPNRTTSASFSQELFKCLKSRIWGFELCLVFPFHLQCCKCIFMFKVAYREWRGRKLKSKD